MEGLNGFRLSSSLLRVCVCVCVCACFLAQRCVTSATSDSFTRSEDWWSSRLMILCPALDVRWPYPDDEKWCPAHNKKKTSELPGLAPGPGWSFASTMTRTHGTQARTHTVRHLFLGHRKPAHSLSLSLHRKAGCGGLACPKGFNCLLWEIDRCEARGAAPLWQLIVC